MAGYMRNVKGWFKRCAKSSTLSTLVVFASANMVITIINGVVSLLQARLVSPEAIGAFQKYCIPTRYMSVLFILVVDGLHRQYPYLIGMGRKVEALAVAAMAKCWYLAATCIVCSLFLVLSIIALCHRDYISVAGWFGQLVVSIQFAYGSFLQIIYRRSLEFKRLSYNGLWEAGVGVVLLSAVKAFGYYGLVIRASLMSIVRFFLDRKYVPEKIACKWDTKIFLSTASISLPLSVIGYINTAFLSATFSYMVLRYCGERSLGLIGMAMSFQTVALLFNNSMVQIFSVKIAKTFGASDSVRKSFEAVIWPTVMSIAISILFALALCIVIKPFVMFFLPKYADTIPVVYVLAIGIPLSAAALPTIILRTALLYKTIYFIGLAKLGTVILYIIFMPKTITWFATALIVGDIVNICLGYVCLCYHSSKDSTIGEKT